MKQFNAIAVLLAGMLIVSCSSSQKFQASVSEDKPLFAAINELNKRPANTKAQTDLQALYGAAIERHENAIQVYKGSTDERRWDKIINELSSLQNIYTSDLKWMV